MMNRRQAFQSAAVTPAANPAVAADEADSGLVASAAPGDTPSVAVIEERLLEPAALPQAEASPEVRSAAFTRMDRREEPVVHTAPRSHAETRRAVVVFVDIVGCSEVSASVGVDDYDEFITEYQKAANMSANLVKQHYRDVLTEVSIRGDETLLVTHCPHVSRDDPGYIQSIDTHAKAVAERAFQFCHMLKFAWYQNRHNRARYLLNIPPRDLAMGIAYGWLTYGTRADGGQRSEGYLLNMAKRVESHSRQGVESKIVYTEPINKWKLPSMIADEMKGAELKGFSGFSVHQTLYELMGIHRETYERWLNDWKVDPEFAADKEAVQNFIQVARGSHSSWLKDTAAVLIAKQNLFDALITLTDPGSVILRERLKNERSFESAQTALKSKTPERGRRRTVEEQ